MVLECLAKAKLEDVFRSTRESMTPSIGFGPLVPLLLAAVGLALLLLLLNLRRKRVATPASLNSPKRLMKEVGKTLPMKSGEMRQLRELAESLNLESPVTLLLCPSLLAKAIAAKPVEERKALNSLIKHIKADKQK